MAGWVVQGGDRECLWERCVGEEGMSEDIADGRAGFGASLQERVDEVLRAWGRGERLGEPVLACFDALVDLLDVARLEGGFPHQQRVQYHAERPDVYLERVAFRLVKDLRCNVVRRATDGFLPFVLRLELRGEPKVAHLQMHLRRQKQVRQFEIAVDDVLRMEILQCRKQLGHVVPNLGFCQPTTTTDKLHKAFIFT